MRQTKNLTLLYFLSGGLLASLLYLAVISRSFELLAATTFFGLPLYLFFLAREHPFTAALPTRLALAACANLLSGSLLFELDTIRDLWLLGLWVVTGGVVLALAALLSAIIFIRNLPRHDHTNLLKTLLHFTVLLLTSLALRSALYTPYKHLDFYWNLPRYTAAVQAIESGQLSPEANGVVHLPQGYQFLSFGPAQIFSDGSNRWLAFSITGTRFYAYTPVGQVPGFARSCSSIAGQAQWYECDY